MQDYLTEQDKDFEKLAVERDELRAANAELLEALQDAVNWLSKLEVWSGPGDLNIETYKAAITKATGEQQ